MSRKSKVGLEAPAPRPPPGGSCMCPGGGERFPILSVDELFEEACRGVFMIGETSPSAHAYIVYRFEFLSPCRIKIKSEANLPTASLAHLPAHIPIKGPRARRKTVQICVDSCILI